MKFKLFGLILIILALSLGWYGMAMAQDEVQPILVEGSDTISGDGEEPPQEEVMAVTELEGLEVVEPVKALSGFGLWWRGIKERVSLAVTLDPVKKAEKQLKFAEERMLMAQKFAEKTDEPKAQARVEQMVQRAQDYAARVEEKKDRLLEQGGERVERLLRNLATHQIRKEELLDKMEEHLPEDKLERWQELRDKTTAEGQRLLNALQNENISERVKEHLQDVKTRIEDHVGVVKEYQEKRRELLQEAKAEDVDKEDLHLQLQELNKEREEELIQVREEDKLKKQEGVFSPGGFGVEGEAQDKDHKVIPLPSKAELKVNAQTTNRVEPKPVERR